MARETAFSEVTGSLDRARRLSGQGLGYYLWYNKMGLTNRESYENPDKVTANSSWRLWRTFNLFFIMWIFIDYDGPCTINYTDHNL